MPRLTRLLRQSAGGLAGVGGQIGEGSVDGKRDASALFDTKSQLLLGERYAEAILILQTSTDP